MYNHGYSFSSMLSNVIMQNNKERLFFCLVHDIVFLKSLGCVLFVSYLDRHQFSCCVYTLCSPCTILLYVLLTLLFHYPTIE